MLTKKYLQFFLLVKDFVKEQVKLVRAQQLKEYCFCFFRWNRKKMSRQQRLARVAQKKKAFLKQQEEADD